MLIIYYMHYKQRGLQHYFGCAIQQTAPNRITGPIGRP